MAQNDFVIADQTASAALADINSALQSLASCSSGATEPSVKYANQLWYDTTTHILKVRNEANSAWINILYVHQADGAVHILDNTYISDTSGNHVGLLGDQATSEWTTGTGTTESLVSPAKIAAAISALASTTSTQVLGFVAAATAGAVGTYGHFHCILRAPNVENAIVSFTAGQTTSGSNLRWSGKTLYSGTPSGTWMCLGYFVDQLDGNRNRIAAEYYTVWKRVS